VHPQPASGIHAPVPPVGRAPSVRPSGFPLGRDCRTSCGCGTEHWSATVTSSVPASPREGPQTVYRAEDRTLGRIVAVKMLHECFAEETELVERFRREARSAAQLRHPHIVAVYDWGAWNGIPYMAMEYVRGRPLKALIREHAPVAPQSAIDLISQLLDAAGHIHQRGIVHRDLKPDNVIVDETGQVRLTDFGTARAGLSDITQTGTIIGTALYISPEQALGHPVPSVSDLYAVGIILYGLLTGRLPSTQRRSWRSCSGTSTSVPRRRAAAILR
jgi:serine/threonine protein kinase